MIFNRYTALLFVCLFLSAGVFSQKKIVVLGSSTAAGTGASSFANSWVGKMTAYFNQNPSDGIDTTVYNLSTGGNHSYSIRPSGSPLPPLPGRGYPDDSRNITAALALNPNIIIVNLPSNDAYYAYNGDWPSYTITETMNNFRQAFSIARAAGVRIFFTTTQPRNLNTQYKDTLVATRDSIIANFNPYYIDFWSDLVNTDGSNTLLPAVNSGDGIHINDVGHNLVFQQVVNKNIFTSPFPLPVKLLSFTANSINRKFINLSWKTTEEEENSSFVVERSADGIQFKTVTEIKARGTTGEHQYTWTDANPLPGHNFYRLRIVERAKQSYSSTVDVNLPYDGIKINTIIPGSQLTINMYSDKNRQAVAAIHSTNGQLLSLQPVSLRSGTQQLQLPFHSKPGILYILEIVSGENQKASFKFIGPE